MVKLDRTIDTCLAVQTSCRDVFKSSSVNCSEIDEGVELVDKRQPQGYVKYKERNDYLLLLLIMITLIATLANNKDPKENNRHIITPPPLE